MSIFFTSDSHFRHRNIIKYQNRPFLLEEEKQAREDGLSDRCTGEQYDRWRDLKLSDETVQRHDEALIQNWNNKVKAGDSVYHLGDFCFGRLDDIHRIANRLNGNIYLILGNHDKTIRKSINDPKIKESFVWVKDAFDLKVDDPDADRGRRSIVLYHYATGPWNKRHHESWHLFGHSHGSYSGCCPQCGYYYGGKSFDVGVDDHNYTPISYEEVKEKMKDREQKPIDRHGLRKDEPKPADRHI